jgi:hypothetical protein
VERASRLVPCGEFERTPSISLREHTHVTVSHSHLIRDTSLVIDLTSLDDDDKQVEGSLALKISRKLYRYFIKISSFLEKNTRQKKNFHVDHLRHRDV